VSIWGASPESNNVPRRKVSKNLGFFVLQDAHGQVQLLARQKNNSELDNPTSETAVSDGPGTLALLDRAPLQSVIQVSGIVKRRLPSAVAPVSSC
jgi:aspartyl-tRNA synthetase